MAFTCDPKDPRAPESLKRVCRNLRWVPFAFIFGLIAYAYLTVAISLAIRYHLANKGEWISALFELLISTVLAGGALWGFVVAVFKDPGSPLGRRNDDRESWAGSSSSMRPESEYEMGSEAEEAQSLMRGQDRDVDTDAGGDRAALFNVPIPGQPQYPARSGRQQLADLQRLPSHASVCTNTAIQRRSNIWVKSSGESRWCAKCDAPKPDRTHHCSSCNRCILRMDHHCPWLANRCVGLRNHKAFFLFVSYTALFCVYCCQETARALLRYVEMENNGFESSPIGWAVVLFLGFIFGASLVPFAGYHAWLICKNRTTIESMEGSGRVRLRVKRDERRPRVEDRLRGIVGSAAQQRGEDGGRAERNRGGKQGGWRSDEHLSREERRALKKASKLNVYDVGAAGNWRQVMGDKWYLWFVPVGEPLSDGFGFLVQTKTLQKLEEITASIRVRDEQGQNRPSSPEEEGDDDSVYGGSQEATRFGYADGSSRNGQPEPPRETGLERQAGQTFNGAHGEMEWGDAPKRSFVLFGVDDDDDNA
ncbi:Palmitoyltransferase PFA3 [Pseudozyma hubeiensis]|nr:Palmitoyltransferase PFA3 [Pseudozyma hubeiensis]